MLYKVNELWHYAGNSENQLWISGADKAANDLASCKLKLLLLHAIL